MPKISVVMSVYNGDRFLKKSMESVCGQTFSDFEFIIIDDGSSDNTRLVLSEFEKNDNRIKVYHQKNTGLTSSLNKAISLSGSEFIARQDADDISVANRLERQIEYMRANPNIALVGASFADIDSEGKVIRKNFLNMNPGTLKKRIIRGNFMCHSSVLFRKDAFLSVGGYDETFLRAQDYRLYFDLLCKYDIGVIPDVLVYKIRRGDAISCAHVRSQRWHGIRARYYAIKRRQYSAWNLFYVFKAIIGNCIPVFLKNKIDRLIYGA